jgi:hypothetical protein
MYFPNKKESQAPGRCPAAPLRQAKTKQKTIKRPNH